MDVKILLADDHKIMRDGLRSMIEKQKDMKVVAEAEDGRTAVSLAQELSPDVVVMDIAMPELNGIEATRQVVASSPGIKVIALSMHSDRRFVSGVLKAGASGYLLKESAFEELVQAIQIVCSGKTYLSPSIAHIVVKDYVSGSPDTGSPSLPALTPREREVLQLLAEGKSTKQIALGLHLSAKTIETHRGRMMKKLGMNSLAQLTKYAVREGLTTLES
jgi:DNA-binding NarL/FixJ family response regulator